MDFRVRGLNNRQKRLLPVDMVLSIIRVEVDNILDQRPIIQLKHLRPRHPILLTPLRIAPTSIPDKKPSKLILLRSS